MEITLVEPEVTEAELVPHQSHPVFFCGPEGELIYKDGFIYSASGRIMGSYTEAPLTSERCAPLADNHSP